MQHKNDSVKKYHQKLTNIRLRFPAPDANAGIPDYLVIIRQRAKELGYINSKGIDKGEGNINRYILHLLEADLGITMVKGMSDLKG